MVIDNLASYRHLIPQIAPIRTPTYPRDQSTSTQTDFDWWKTLLHQGFETFDCFSSKQLSFKVKPILIVYHRQHHDIYVNLK